MANTVISQRTNYFRVKNLEEFKELVEYLDSEEGVTLNDKEINGEMYVSLNGMDYVTVSELEDIDEEEMKLLDDPNLEKLIKYFDGDGFNVFLFIQEHIREGDVCVSIEIAKEKMRYLGANTMTITSEAIELTCLNSHMEEQVKKLSDGTQEIELYY